MNKAIRIGTRDSQLALWQAETVQQKLEEQGYQTQLVPVKSDGDLNLSQPLYELGIRLFLTAMVRCFLQRGPMVGERINGHGPLTPMTSFSRILDPFVTCPNYHSSHGPDN